MNKPVYLIADDWGSVRIEPARYGDDAYYVQTYATPEAARLAADMLNDESGYVILPDRSLEQSRPWKVFELKEIG